MTAADQPGVIETHVSTVFFAGDRAYKLLKPIRTSFLDHRTVDSRHQAVLDELSLNRRMAADVYLGTATVVEHDKVVDHMLVMRRLPADRRLSTLLGRHTHGDCLRGVARAIATFHAAQKPLPSARAIAGRDAVRINWADNLRDIGLLKSGDLDTALLEEVHGLAMTYLAHSESLFDRRLHEGYVRDGHGDLTAQDIFCLDDGPRIIDCLAFNADLRIGDVLLDVAFLAMDAERLAGGDAAEDLWRYYAEFSGEHHPASLASHYIAYRAGVRAKVSALRVQQGDPSARELVDTYLRQAHRHLMLAKRRVVVIGGAPGTGKSTLAQGVSDELGYPVIRSDAVRKELAGRGWNDHDVTEVDQGLYRPAATDATYEEVFARARRLLEHGSSVILDASFTQQAHRDVAWQLATDWGADLTELRCTADPETAARRVSTRLERNGDPSDAHPSILPELRKRMQDWPSATNVPTDGLVHESISAALTTIGVQRTVRSTSWHG